MFTNENNKHALAKKTGPQQDLLISKRHQIMAGAMTVFLKNGFAASSMELIAKESGVSKGTLYNHFESKQLLFSTIIESECAKIQTVVFDLKHATGTPEAVLLKVGTGFMLSVLDAHAMCMYRTLIAESQNFPSLGQLFMRSGPNRGANALGKYLRQLKDEGVLSIGDEVHAAHQFIGLCEAGIFNHSHFLAEKPTSQQLHAHITSAVNVFLKAYRVNGQ